MNINIKYALENIYLLRKEDDSEGWDDLISSLEQTDEDISHLEDERDNWRAKANQLGQELDEVEEELERCASFPVESLEDELKIEILKKLYKEKSLIQLDDMLKVNSQNQI